MFAALAVFIVASILCAAAPTIELLTLARLLQGLGGGGLMTLSQALIGESIPPRERARYQGYLAAVAVCRQFLRSGGRRLSHRAFRLAVDFSDQRADRAGRGRADLAAAAAQIGRASPLARRPRWLDLVHRVRGDHAAGARAGAARQFGRAARCCRAVGGRNYRAGAAGAAREPRAIAAHPARAAAACRRSGAATPWPRVTAPRWCR